MNSFEQNNDPTPGSIVNKVFGFALLLIGISIGIWVISVIYNLLVDPTQVGLINMFANEMDRIVTFPSGEVELPAGIYIAGGYLVVCILLSICAGVAKAFVKAGAHLVQSDFKDLVTKLTDEMKAVLKKSTG